MERDMSPPPSTPRHGSDGVLSDVSVDGALDGLVLLFKEDIDEGAYVDSDGEAEDPAAAPGLDDLVEPSAEADTLDDDEDDMDAVVGGANGDDEVPRGGLDLGALVWLEEEVLEDLGPPNVFEAVEEEEAAGQFDHGMNGAELPEDDEAEEEEVGVALEGLVGLHALFDGPGLHDQEDEEAAAALPGLEDFDEFLFLGDVEEGPAAALALGDIVESEAAGSDEAEASDGGWRGRIRTVAVAVGLGTLLACGAAGHRFCFNPRPNPAAAAANTEASVGLVVDCGAATGGRGGPCYPLDATSPASAPPLHAGFLHPRRFNTEALPTADAYNPPRDADAGRVRFPAVDCGMTGHGFCFPAGTTSSAPPTGITGIKAGAECMITAADAEA